MSKRTILYLHGFNSSGTGKKAAEFVERLKGDKVLTPSLNYKNCDDAVKLIASLFRTNKIDVVIGTSLGGFFALWCAHKYGVRCIVVNPTTSPNRTLAKMLGENKNFVTGEKYLFTPTDLEKYAAFEASEFSKIVVDNRTTFVLSTDDELLGDHHYLEALYPECSNFNYFDQQGHRFTSVKTILKFL